jgi:predicted transcriptional regulator
MDKKEISVLNLLQKIQSGAVDPRDMDKEVRKQVVEALACEGSSVPQIAQILKVSDKTIRRDLSSIKENNAFSPSIEMAKKLIGDMRMKAEVHRTYLMRLARTKNVSVSERSLAEYYSWKVTKELIEKLQSLGYLPLVPHKIAADVYHHDDEDNPTTLGELKDKLTALEGIAQEDGIFDGELKEEMEFLKLKINTAEIKKRVVDSTKKDKEDNNGQSNKE